MTIYLINLLLDSELIHSFFIFHLQKGDILLSVDGTSLCGLTHSQAVATLKATINLDQVVLGIMEGPETSYGKIFFIFLYIYKYVGI